MKLGTQVKKLQKKIKRESNFKANSLNSYLENDVLIKNKKKIFSNEVKKDLIKHLEFLKELLELIEKGATGFDLAYKIEKNKEIKNLIFDGILFYNTFIEIGNKKFKDIPDKRKVDYRTFRTIEDTEKYIFLVWIKDTIQSIEKEVKTNEDYQKYLEKQEVEEINRERIKLREALTQCKECGDKIKNKTQELCEKCGANLWKQVKKELTQ